MVQGGFGEVWLHHPIFGAKSEVTTRHVVWSLVTTNGPIRYSPREAATPHRSEVAVLSFRECETFPMVRRCCPTSSPASYGYNPVFPRSLLDFGEVRSLQYVQPQANRRGSPWTDDDNARRSIPLDE